MEQKKSLNLFEEVHRKVQERLARDRESQEKDSEIRKKREEEALRHRFDRDSPS